jgi:electron transport complex protein RnfD
MSNPVPIQTFGRETLSSLNQKTLLALLPGLLLSLWFQGLPLLLTMLLAIAAGLLFETLGLLLRRQSPTGELRNGGFLLSALLLALLLPAGSPWWMPLTGVALALLLFKHAFGGLGQHPFHPVMAACLMLMLIWPADWQGSTGLEQNSLIWTNLAFLAGGLALAAARVINWTVPLSLLFSLALLTWFGQTGADSWHSIEQQLLIGPVILVAFFVATDSASSAQTRLGRLLYGCLIGGLIFFADRLSNYSQPLAVAVVLGNFAAPVLDLLGRPRIYGHPAAKPLPTMEDISGD